MSAAPLLIDDRQAWLERRRSCITATDVAAILGLHPYSTSHQVYLEKTGQAFDKEPNEAMQTGLDMEPSIAFAFARITGKPVQKADFVTHPDKPRHGATCDYFAGSDEVVECKVAGIHAAQGFGDGKDEIPTHYLIQCMWQLYVTGRKVAYLAVLLPNPKIKIYTIKRDEEMIRRMVFQVEKFDGEYLLAENPPPLSGHEPDTEYIKAKHPTDNGDLIQADDDTEDLAAELGNWIGVKRDAELKCDELTNQIKAFMGDASTLKTNQGFFTWKSPKPTVKTDWEAIALDLGATEETIAKHTTEKANTRRFLTPFKSEKA